MSECINCGKKGCNPKVNSECVIYNGNYITGVNISKGDNFTTVVNKLASNAGTPAENTSAVNLSGPGVGVFTSKVGANIQLRRINAGTGVQVTENGNNILITNMAPDQVVSLSAGNNVTITGTYPNFTISATSTGGSGGGAGQGNLFN